jgi:hypothetical protein
MRLDIAVMGHVTRLEQAHRLADQQHALLALDAGGLGENACGDLAWRYAAGRGDWSIVLQDDAVPVPYFREHALAALGELSLEPRDAVVSFYTGTGRPRAEAVAAAVKRADQVGAAWLEADTLLWGVAVAIPTRLVADMLRHVGSSGLPYDQRIGSWARAAGLPVLYCWPSLVDHADGPRVAQTGGRRARRGQNPPRHAHRVGIAPSWKPWPRVRIAASYAPVTPEVLTE